MGLNQENTRDIKSWDTLPFKLYFVFWLSWGNSCGEKGVPGVYTDVYKMLQQDNFWLCDSLGIPKPKCPALTAQPEQDD